ncbi:DNA repair protein RadA [Oscillospiraceae bacterium MB08-C2-2]|nr:DNA repair protein RadA [Oscillospiraceae bacterium MB08-C2-2]
MAAKAKTVHVCSQCGFESPRWYGKCPECSEWNTFVEETRLPPSPKEKLRATVASPGQLDAAVSKITVLDASDEIRQQTGLSELDRVLGGGIVDGSVMLLAGDPGIGKSTLLLQICNTLCQGKKVLYIAGEESPRQIKMRAIRLGIDSENLFVAAVTDIEKVVSTIEYVNPDMVMVDSIQTMNLATLSSSNGSVSQVRECTQWLIRAAKSMEIPVFIVGHVNKDGGIAGPKVLEHMVDVVLYFEGERHSTYRILRAVKNRFGSTNEIGVFEMGESGLVNVENPSLMLLSGRPVGISGTCVACVMEGSRPILAEVQALVSKTGFGTPRRMSTGFDYNRAALLMAVLEKRGGFFFGNMDAYINIIGGLHLDEPAADLSVAIALVSNLLDKPLGDDVAAFGEIGLAGEVRSVSHAALRINECARLGFSKVIIPHACLKGLSLSSGSDSIEIVGVKGIRQALALLG